MLGKHTGLGVRLQHEFRFKNLIQHHCLPHRLERVILHAKERSPGQQFPNFWTIERDYNAMSYFYKDPKRISDLRKRLREQNKRVFSLNHIHEIRWVDSHHRETLKFIKHWPELIDHLKKIIEDPQFDRETSKKAEEFQDILQNKHMISSLSFMLDVQEILKVESKLFQERGSTIIGQGRRREHLLDRLNALKIEGGGPWTAKMLATSRCP